MSMKPFWTVLIVAFAAATAFSQAARVRQLPNQAPNSNPTNTAAPAAPETSVTAEQMYKEVNDYAVKKFTEFEQKKVPVSERLRKQTLNEQKQLAAKYAALLTPRTDLTVEEEYYLGLLHWWAENIDGADAAFRKFLGSEKPVIEKAQTARSLMAVIGARKRNFDEAEKFLAEYLNHDPVRLRERVRAEIELAEGYRLAQNFQKAAAHAEEAYRITKALFQEYSSRAKALADLLDAGATLFDIYRQSDDREKAESALVELRKTGAFVQSTGIYYYAADNLIRYLIETGRKPRAMEFYKSVSDLAAAELTAKPYRAEIEQRMKKREKQYRILGETPPELVEIANWFPGQPQKLASLKGKVVVIDFWATWCGPCIVAFPSLTEMYQTYHSDGLEILGVTRFYGAADGLPADEPSEIEFLKQFRTKQRLPYDFIVSNDPSNHEAYGANGIPLTVIIDRKGIIRYIESGSSETREREIRETVEKLIAEK